MLEIINLRFLNVMGDATCRSSIVKKKNKELDQPFVFLIYGWLNTVVHILC